MKALFFISIFVAFPALGQVQSDVTTSIDQRADVTTGKKTVTLQYSCTGNCGNKPFPAETISESRNFESVESAQTFAGQQCRQKVNNYCSNLASDSSQEDSSGNQASTAQTEQNDMDQYGYVAGDGELEADECEWLQDSAKEVYKPLFESGEPLLVNDPDSASFTDKVESSVCRGQMICKSSLEHITGVYQQLEDQLEKNNGLVDKRVQEKFEQMTSPCPEFLKEGFCNWKPKGQFNKCLVYDQNTCPSATKCYRENYKYLQAMKSMDAKEERILNSTKETKGHNAGSASQN
ncbi:MAG: hypothetical protein WEB87_01630 [Bacteriovoracaceae bacterium]